MREKKKPPQNTGFPAAVIYVPLAGAVALWGSCQLGQEIDQGISTTSDMVSQGGRNVASQVAGQTGRAVNSTQRALDELAQDVYFKSHNTEADINGDKICVNLTMEEPYKGPVKVETWSPNKEAEEPCENQTDAEGLQNIMDRDHDYIVDSFTHSEGDLAQRVLGLRTAKNMFNSRAEDIDEHEGTRFQNLWANLLEEVVEDMYGSVDDAPDAVKGYVYGARNRYTQAQD